MVLHAKIFFILIMFLREQSWRNSFAMKFYGNCYLNSLFFYHKVHGDVVKGWRFEGSEEHRRCSGQVTDFRLAGVEELFP